MALELIIIGIVAIAVALVVFVRKGNKKASGILGQILGAVMLVCGLLGLFIAFFMLFHGRDEGLKFWILGGSLLLIFGGFFLVRWSERKTKSSG